MVNENSCLIFVVKTTRCNESRVFVQQIAFVLSAPLRLCVKLVPIYINLWHSVLTSHSKLLDYRIQ
jgi:hypothetical protein